jgi:hypothetical protein
MAFSDKLMEMLNSGMAASRDIVAKASAKAATWGEMGVLKVEVMQYRSQAEKLTAKLGAEAYAAFAERKEASLSADSTLVRELVERITELGRIIDEKEADFHRLGGKDSDLGQ